MSQLQTNFQAFLNFCDDNIMWIVIVIIAMLWAAVCMFAILIGVFL